MKQLKQFED